MEQCSYLPESWNKTFQLCTPNYGRLTTCKAIQLSRRHRWGTPKVARRSGWLAINKSCVDSCLPRSFDRGVDAKAHVFNVAHESSHQHSWHHLHCIQTVHGWCNNEHFLSDSLELLPEWFSSSAMNSRQLMRSQTVPDNPGLHKSASYAKAVFDWERTKSSIQPSSCRKPIRSVKVCLADCHGPLPYPDDARTKVGVGVGEIYMATLAIMIGRPALRTSPTPQLIAVAYCWFCMTPTQKEHLQQAGGLPGNEGTWL
jgi:hypothetical protein